MTNSIQECINEKQSILGYEVVGIDGCQSPYLGVIKELSIQDHSVLGKLIKVWVAWDSNPEHLTSYEPRQFSKWGNGKKGIGVYYKGGN